MERGISAQEVVLTAASEKADVSIGLNQQQAGFGQKRNFCTANALAMKESKPLQDTCENYWLCVVLNNCLILRQLSYFGWR